MLVLLGSNIFNRENIMIFICICALVVYIFTKTELFTNETKALVKFKSISNEIIKSINLTLPPVKISNNSIQTIFDNNLIIRIEIPSGFISQLFYKYKSGGFSNLIELYKGSHIIKKQLDKEYLEHIIIITEESASKLTIPTYSHEDLMGLQSNSNSNPEPNPEPKPEPNSDPNPEPNSDPNPEPNQDPSQTDTTHYPIVSNSNQILVVNRYGNIIYKTFDGFPIDWANIYMDYGLDNYYMIYPWGRRLYYYWNYPYYRNYLRFRDDNIFYSRKKNISNIVKQQNILLNLPSNHTKSKLNQNVTNPIKIKSGPNLISNATNPRTKSNVINPITRSNAINPRTKSNVINPITRSNATNPRTRSNAINPRTSMTNPRIRSNTTNPIRIRQQKNSD
jgi:hypothetical protein